MPWRWWRLKLRLRGYDQFFDDVLFSTAEEARDALAEFTTHYVARKGTAPLTKIAMRLEPHGRWWHLEVWAR